MIVVYELQSRLLDEVRVEGCREKVRGCMLANSCGSPCARSEPLRPAKASTSASCHGRVLSHWTTSALRRDILSAWDSEINVHHLKNGSDDVGMHKAVRKLIGFGAWNCLNSAHVSEPFK